MLPLIALLLQAPGIAAAESLLTAHDLPAARTVAERLTRSTPDDPRVHVVLGHVWLAWPTVGRYEALKEFRTASRLAPGDLEAWYGQIEVGDALGSDEGERMVREAILRIFALTPDYRDCWARFEQLYHDLDIWRRADRALATHTGDALALARRAEIALALEDPLRADSLAALALIQRPADPSIVLVRAQAAFLAHHDRAGQAWYDSALVHADRDTAGVLWDQIWMIASPAEVARHDSIDAADEGAFLRWFWDKRDPNLVTPWNERIAEHYRRLAEVRRLFRLLHPYARYHRSPTYRALVATYEDDSSAAPVLANGFDALPPADFLYPSLSSVNDTLGRLTVYARANLSARGLVWLRHGRPDVWESDRSGGGENFFAVHQWTYYTPQGPLSISFEGIPGPFGGHGDYIVAPPRNRHQARQVRALLTTDATSIPAPLPARAWSAFFRSGTAGATDVYFRAAPDTAAAVLWNEDGTAVAHARGPGVLRVAVAPGSYQLGLDVDSAGVLGRAREALLVPALGPPALGLSSLVLAPPPVDSLPGRDVILAAMPADLVYPAGRPLAAYTEIYGLQADSEGRARYTVRYSFAPIRSLPRRLLGGATPVAFEFTREAPSAGIAIERIVIEPGRVPPGRYRVTLAVTDLAANVKSQTTAIEITIR